MSNMKNFIVINKQHTLLPQQESLLREAYPEGYEVISVPAEGWTVKEQNSIWCGLCIRAEKEVLGDLVFVSPVPYLMALAAYNNGVVILGVPLNVRVGIMHNEHREKKELPNGKIISVVSSEGWKLVFPPQQDR